MSAASGQVKSRSLVERIADAVLYEGYLLYPYRPTAVKNQQRWNFGVVCPQAYEQVQQGNESATMRTECLIEAGGSTTITVRVRFLHLMLRESKDVADPVLGRAWQEAVEREVSLPRVRIGELESVQCAQFEFPASRATEKKGLVVRTQQAIAGEIQVSATKLDNSYEIGNRRLAKVSVVISNLSEFEAASATTRDDALMRSFVSTHTILEVEDGSFVSLLDPPEPYQAVASECVNKGTYPVLVGAEGDRGCVLSSPIILYDYPQIAPQSAGDLFDGTEIDEILTLRIMSLTDDEKREMRNADELARKLLERTESMSHEQLLNLHGVMKKV